MVVADVSFNDIFWSVLWFFFLFIWLMILFHILTDLFRDHSASGVEKTLWVLFLVFLPFLAAFIYMIVRGKGMGERAAAQQHRAQQDFEGYVRNVATTGEVDTHRADRQGQGAAGRGRDRPVGVRSAEGQSPRLRAIGGGRANPAGCPPCPRAGQPDPRVPATPSELKDQGILTEEESSAQKTRILSG